MAEVWADSNMSDNLMTPISAPRGPDATASSLLVAEPTEFERKRFAKILATVSAAEGIHLPSFLTAESDTLWWMLNLDPLLKGAHPATDNRLGALRMPGAVPGRAGDLDLCKLWVAVAYAGGVNNVRLMIHCGSRVML